MVDCTECMNSCARPQWSAVAPGPIHMPMKPLPKPPPVRPKVVLTTTLALDFVVELQYGSGKKIGLPNRFGQMTFSSSSVATVPCAAVIAPLE